MYYSNDEMIEMLVENDFNSIMSGDAIELLNSYLEFGHKGYRDYSEMELIQECRERNLIDNILEFKSDNYRIVKNLMSGKYAIIEKDTPWACNPASETYWSM